MYKGHGERSSLFDVQRDKVQYTRANGQIRKEAIMRKKYQSTHVEILPIESSALMIPVSDPGEPHLVPKGHFVPGRGASYAPPAKII
jgi:hypothetical protein